ncbi:Protein arginine N-methyltransferase 2 [Dissostichus eleginoides]|uniref:Protein arginine N-methyltransferase 2 n=1 Tax=Dissostichus eleginoides TaxID=100907 RepID=A0AAD9CKD4_DISEL|nr:Protein arginine N-methyltransferase 2 [Dissostichus eleginoides]
MQTEKEDDDASVEEYVALSNFTGGGSNQLSFRSGDTLLVHAKTSSEWLWSELQGAAGRRTEAYRQVILSNSAPLRNKVVMDLGCGTGIISLFCAQLARPSQVFAVGASSMAEYTSWGSRTAGRAEDIHLPERVDILVSEWMGNCLLFEFMVESVLLARDRWLKEGGVMWPSSAALTLVPCQANSYYAEKMAFWEQPYGLDCTPLHFNSHLIDPSDCLTAPCDVLRLDMYTLEIKDLEEIKGQFHFGVEKPTHWKQTLFMLDRPVRVLEGDSIAGTIVLRRNPVWRRHMTITLHWSINSSTGGKEKGQVGKKSFPMWR